jgi:hypothetical protein
VLHPLAKYKKKIKRRTKKRHKENGEKKTKEQEGKEM